MNEYDLFIHELFVHVLNKRLRPFVLSVPQHVISSPSWTWPSKLAEGVAKHLFIKLVKENNETEEDDEINNKVGKRKGVTGERNGRVKKKKRTGK